MLSPIRETAQFCTPSSFFTVRSMPEEHAAHVIPVIEYFFFMMIALLLSMIARGGAAAPPRALLNRRTRVGIPFLQLSFLMSSTVSETMLSSPALIFSLTQVARCSSKI